MGLGSLLISSARRESSKGRALRVVYSRFRASLVGLGQFPPGAQAQLRRPSQSIQDTEKK